MHPLNTFKYCPRCGSINFKENDFKSKRCFDCHFVYYFNSSASTAVFITDAAGRLLVTERANNPAKGSLDLPGGFVDLSETAEEAIRREVLEEAGLVLGQVNYLFSLPNIYNYSDFEVHTLDLFFESRIEKIENLTPADDVSKLYLLSKDSINPSSFGLSSIQKAIQNWLKQS